jgi:hypothetical protein
MQNTGVPLNSMPIAIILILIGLAGAFRVKKP